MIIIPLPQIKEDHLPVVGSKAYSLAVLMKEKFAVPEGFVISSEAFSFFLKETDIGITIESELSKVSLDDLHSVDYASRLIKDLIVGAEMPTDLMTVIMQQFAHIPGDFVAVRSSAFSEKRQIAWAGELDSYLHVSVAELAEKIKACWASLFSTRSIFYLKQQNLDIQTANIAIIVQTMIEAEASGRAYSVHPVTQDKDQVVIEAEMGLSDTTEKGEITPDTYVVHALNKKILDKNIHSQAVIIESVEEGTMPRDLPKNEAGKQKLTDEDILLLVAEVKKIEKALGHPVDIEWVQKEGFFFLQARELKIL